MKLIALTVFTILFGGSVFSQNNTPKARYDSVRTFRCGGLEREYRLYAPADLADGAPLVIYLHGYGGSFNQSELGFNELADREGFAICYPQGSKDSLGKNCWNVGYPFQKSMKVDDVAFICNLVQHLQKTYNLSRKNIFCTGMSNGGEMCYLLAYTASDTFAAVAPIAGLTMEWMYNKLEYKRPIPLLEVHGTQDRISEWYGDHENAGGWGAYIPVPIAVGYWVAANKCKRLSEQTIPSLDKQNDRYIVAHHYTDGIGGNEVWLYQIINGEHAWGDKDIDTTELIWSFFRRFIR